MSDTALSPDYANENKAGVILAIGWALTMTAGLFVGLRLTVRVHKLRRLRVDDGVLVVSQILGFIYVGFVTAAVRAGAGRHVATLARPQVEAATMHITLSYVPGIMSFGLPKLAVISLLIQLLTPSYRHAALLWAVSAICLALLVSAIASTYARCSPPRALWTLDIPGAKCQGRFTVVAISVAAGGESTTYHSVYVEPPGGGKGKTVSENVAAFSAFLDLYLAVYPAIVLWQLKMKLLRKLALTIALGLGIVACGAGIYKCTEIPSVGDEFDFTYSTASLTIWTSIEANCVIIAACIPPLAPLLDICLGWNPLGPRTPMPTEVYNNYVRRHGTLSQ